MSASLWFVVPVVTSALDRYRGSGDTKLPGGARKVLYGIGASLPLLMVGVNPLVALLWAGLFALGSAPGWGFPYGVALGGEPNPEGPESWQKGVLKTNEWLALAFRGFMWIAPTWLLMPHLGLLTTLIYTVAMTVAMPAGAYLARDMQPFRTRWPNSEYIRGAIFGLISLLIILV